MGDVITGELFGGKSWSLVCFSDSFATLKVGGLIFEGRIWRRWVGGGGNEGRTLVFFGSVLVMVVMKNDVCLYWAVK